MRVQNDQLAQQQIETLQTLRAITMHLAKNSANTLTEDSKRILRQLATWLDNRVVRSEQQAGLGTKASVTRTRLFCLQLEKLLEKLENTQEPSRQRWICDEFDELVASHQQRYLYEDMIVCLRELSTLCIERGDGRQAVMYNDMASRLETRLECGHIDLADEEQRAKDEALFAEFKQKLEAMRP